MTWPSLLVCAVMIGVVCAIHRIRYCIDDRYVRVMLGWFTLRRIALADISSVDCAAPFWNEHWCNTFVPGGREVCIRRKSGLIRNFIITPENREEFIRELQGKLIR